MKNLLIKKIETKKRKREEVKEKMFKNPIKLCWNT